MRNPGGREFSQGIAYVSAKQGGIEGAAAKLRLKSARRKEKSPPWSPKESSSPPGTWLLGKLGVGKHEEIPIYPLGSAFALCPIRDALCAWLFPSGKKAIVQAGAFCYTFS